MREGSVIRGGSMLLGIEVGALGSRAEGTEKQKDAEDGHGAKINKGSAFHHLDCSAQSAELWPMRILFVEDDRRISDFLIKGLEETGFAVTLARSAEEARDLMTCGGWGLILLDIMLPGMDGIQLTRLIRFKKDSTPIMVLSALNDPMDKVSALDSGADDYITKPFHFKELISRIKALTRRASGTHGSGGLLNCRDLTVDVEANLVTRAGRTIDLSPREFKLLTYLLENKGRVCGRTQILHTVWDINYNNNSNVVDVYVSYLRSKIDDAEGPSLIQTVKGRGYVMREE